MTLRLRLIAFQSSFFTAFVRGTLVAVGLAGMSLPAQTVSKVSGTVNFGSVAVATATPQTETLTFTFGTGGTVLAPVVLTQGAAGLDFTDAGTGSCTTNGAGYSYAAFTTCTVVVKFGPKYPGVRMGAVELENASGTVISTELIYGVGTGPQGAFVPGGLSSVVGTGTQCVGGTGTICGDGGQAVAAQLNGPAGVVLDGAGNLYVGDGFDNRVREVTAAGVVSTIAGTGATCGGTPSTCGDGGLATAAELNNPYGLALDGAGNLYIEDSGDNAIRKITAATGIISTVAGTGTACANPNASTSPCGDGGAATSATLNTAGGTGLAVDGAGNIYIPDGNDNRVRLVSASTRLISTIAGNGSACAAPTAASNPCGDGSTAASGNTTLNFPSDVAVDASGNVYIADYNDYRVRMVASGTGVLSTVAGNGTACTSTPSLCGDGGTAANSSATVGPVGVAVDAAGDIYISDAYSSIRKVTHATGIISTLAGNNTGCSPSTAACGDGSSAISSSAELNFPVSVRLDGAGDLYIADTSDNRVRKVTASAYGISFGSRAVGTTSTSQAVTMANIGTSSLLTSTFATTSDDFTLLTPTGYCVPALSIGSGNSCTVNVEFAPQSVDVLAGDVNVTDSNLAVAGTVQQIPLTGTGTGISDAALVFEQLPYGSETTASTPPAANTIAAGASAGIITVAVTNGAGEVNYGSTDQIQLVVTQTISSATVTTTYKTGSSTVVTNGNNVGTETITPTLVNGIATFDLSSVPQYTVSSANHSTTAAVYTYTITDLTTTSLAAVSAYVNVSAGTTGKAYAVTEFDDMHSASPTVANCSNANAYGVALLSTCTLRDALKGADTTTNLGSTIFFSSSSWPQTITLMASMEATTYLGYTMTISGPGQSKLFISGANAYTIFTASTSTQAANLTFSGMTLEYAKGQGAALYLSGPATVNNVTFYGNSSPSSSGGAMYIYGTPTSTSPLTVNVTINNSVFENNSVAGSYGGAISQAAGTYAGALVINNSYFLSNSTYSSGAGVESRGLSLTINDSTFTNNIAGSSTGGGAAVEAQEGTASVAGTITMNNDTFYGNVCPCEYGGAMYLGSYSSTTTTSTLNYVTVVGNEDTGEPAGTPTAGKGGGIYSSSLDILNLNNSVVAGNASYTTTSNPNLYYYSTSGYFTNSGSFYQTSQITADTLSVYPTGPTVLGLTSTPVSVGGVLPPVYQVGSTASITAFSITSNVATFTATNTFTPGQVVTLTGFTSPYAYLNGTYTISATNATATTGVLSTTTFSVPLVNANVASVAVSGTATVASGFISVPVMQPLPGSQLIRYVSGTNSKVPASAVLPLATATDARGLYRPSSPTYTSAGLVDLGAVQTDLSLSFTSALPTGATVGTAFNAQPTVAVEDSGYAIPYAVPVTMALSAGTLAGTTTVSTSATTGVATFSGLYTDNVETGVDFVASAGSATSDLEADLGGFNVTSPVSQLVFTTAPTSSVTSTGSAGTVVVTIENSSNVTVTDNSVITLTVSGPGGYAATYTQAAVGGVATFSLGSVALNTAGSYTYTAGYPGGLYTAMASETVAAGAVTHLEVSEPSVTTAGFAESTTVKALDAGQNVVTTFTGTATFTSSDALAVLPASYTFVAGDNGVHVFTTTLNTPGTQTITGTSSSPSDTGTQMSVVVQDSVWLLNAAGPVVAVSEQGSGLTGAVGTSGTASSVGGMAFDSAGGVWSATPGSNALDYVSANGTGTATYSGGGLSSPVAVGVDGLGYVWVANSGGASVSEFKNSGAAQSGASGYGASGTAAIGAGPSGVAIDNTGGVWVVSKTAGTVTHLVGAGAPVTVPLASATAGAKVGVEP